MQSSILMVTLAIKGGQYRGQRVTATFW